MSPEVVPTRELLSYVRVMDDFVELGAWQRQGDEQGSDHHSTRVRLALGLEIGSFVEFVAGADGSIKIVPATQSIRDLKGIVGGRCHVISLGGMDQAIADAVFTRRG